MSKQRWGPMFLYVGWLVGTLGADAINPALVLYQPPHIEAEIGHHVNLTCTFNYNGKTNKIFGKFYRGILEHDREVTCQPFVSSDYHSACELSYTINNPSPRDEGMYYCQVVIPGAEDSIEVRGTGTNLSLHAEPSSVEIWELSPLVSGSEATLNCKVSGFYPGNPTVLWLHSGNPFPGNITKPTTTKNGTYSLQSQYKFSPTIADHTTTYTCQVSHQAWKQQRTASIALNVRYGPIVVSVSSESGAVTNGSVRVTNGSHLNLRCASDGNPRPKPQWLGGSLKEAQPVDTLHISAVQKEDEGLYWCLAKNEYGERNTSITLLVSDRNHGASTGGHKALYGLTVIPVALVLAIVVISLQKKEEKKSSTQAGREIVYAKPKSRKKKSKLNRGVTNSSNESQLVYTDIVFHQAPRNMNITSQASMAIYSEVGNVGGCDGERGDQQRALDSVYTLAELPK